MSKKQADSVEDVGDRLLSDGSFSHSYGFSKKRGGRWKPHGLGYSDDGGYKKPWNPNYNKWQGNNKWNGENKWNKGDKWGGQKWQGQKWNPAGQGYKAQWNYAGQAR